MARIFILGGYMENVIPPQLLAGAMAMIGFGYVVKRFLPAVFRQVSDDMVQREKPRSIRAPLQLISVMQQLIFKGLGLLCMAAGVFLTIMYLLGFLGLNPLGL
jgi:hypothetical protein